MPTIKVELRKHVGIQQTRLGSIEVEHAQRLIMVTLVQNDGTEATSQVGLVGTQPGAPINFMRQPSGQEWPKPIKDAVRKQVALELGDESRNEAQPPAPQPVVLPVDEEELDDGDTDVMPDIDD